MMSQHVQTATLTVEVSQERSREGMLVEAIARITLEDAIAKLQGMFEWFIRHTTFDFATLQMYGACSKLK
jgi:hypothetical protein